MPRGVYKSRCTVCAHEQRVRIDYLVASGTVALTAIARRFGLKRDALARHADNHITQDFRRTVRFGPFESIESLTAACAETGKSVIENLRGAYAMIASRAIAAFEAGDDQRLTQVMHRLHQNLELQAKLSGELMPAQTTNIHVGTVITAEAFAALAGDLIGLVRKHPEIRDDLACILRARMRLPEPARIIEDEQADAA